MRLLEVDDGEVNVLAPLVVACQFDERVQRVHKRRSGARAKIHDEEPFASDVHVPQRGEDARRADVREQDLGAARLVGAARALEREHRHLRSERRLDVGVHRREAPIAATIRQPPPMRSFRRRSRASPLYSFARMRRRTKFGIQSTTHISSAYLATFTDSDSRASSVSRVFLHPSIVKLGPKL